MKKRGLWLCLGAFVAVIVALAISLSGGDEGMTPLMLAAHDGQTDYLKARIAAHDDLNARSRYGWTALMFAAWQGHQDEVLLLLDAGADPNLVSGAVESKIETTAGMPPTTALRVALQYGRRDIASLLIDRGVEVDDEAIALAGGCADMPLLEKLDRKGVNWSAPPRNAFHPTALLTAAEAGNEPAILWLLARRVNIDAVEARETALTCAIRGDQPGAVKLLLERGANPNVVVDGETALWKAIGRVRSFDNTMEIVRLLVTHGADRHFKWKYSPDTPYEHVQKDLAEFRAMSFENSAETPAQSAARKASLCDFNEKLAELLKD